MSCKKRVSNSRIISPGTCLHVFRVRRGDAYFTFCLLYFLVNFCLLLCVQVVGPTNELVEAKLQLKVETQRIFSQMTLKASALGSASSHSFVDFCCLHVPIILRRSTHPDGVYLWFTQYVQLCTTFAWYSHFWCNLCDTKENPKTKK